jgi:membrane-associated protease RseP (regulator of RpoE activity)
MGRCLLALALLPAAACLCAQAQTSSRTKPANFKNQSPPSGLVLKELFPGFVCTAVPEPLVSHLGANMPILQNGGILVRQIEADSAAAQAGLRQYDILLSCNGRQIKDAEQFAGLIRTAKADRKVELLLIRGGKEMTLDVDLRKALEQLNSKTAKDPRGTVKNGRPPEVTVQATALNDSGKMEITFEYYPHGKSKRVTYTGTLDEVENQVKNLPKDIQDFARVALNRLRNRKSPVQPVPPGPSRKSR